ncbi:MAG: hypothetical protein IT577_23770 [Verrucomicrobiae bacterium]|nr:hypothetical protein [Verrucomicrobiae bacterium]
MMRASEELAANTRDELPEIARKTFGPAWAEIDRLIAMAEDPDVGDAAFLAAVKDLHDRVPELWDKIDSSHMADALERAMGAALANGAQGE